MSLVDTSKGPIERSELTAVDEVIETDSARITTTKWFYKGELVKRDVHINQFRGLSGGAHSGS